MMQPYVELNTGKKNTAVHIASQFKQGVSREEPWLKCLIFSAFFIQIKQNLLKLMDNRSKYRLV